MTGRELIMYILEHKLEDEVFFGDDEKIPGFMTVEQVAAQNNVGVATIKAWLNMGEFKTIKIGDTYYIATN